MNANISPAKRLELFPISTKINNQRITIANCDLEALAEQHGTPLYLYDRLSMDHNLTRYRKALEYHYPAESGLTYAGKAFLCLGIAQWTKGQGLWLDCTGVGEISIAKAAELPREQLVVHGVSKSQADLAASLEHAGTIVVDNLDELNRLVSLFRTLVNHQRPNLWLRIRPGMAVDTHSHTQTGQENSKFGLSSKEFLEAVGICKTEGMPLTGLHFHQGSHFHDPSPLGPAIDIALSLIYQASIQHGWQPQTLCPGGGWGVAYHDDDLPHPNIDEYVSYIANQIITGCETRKLPLPRLHLEPGRSLIAQAGVTLYRLQSVKHTADRRWLLVDGGLADNPRPALYGARYSALPIAEPERTFSNPAWIGGPYCESGDVLIEGIPMAELNPDELIAVPVTGAYQLSMGSNYNGARKPAVLWLEDNRASLIQRRETPADLLRRDMPLPLPRGEK